MNPGNHSRNLKTATGNQQEGTQVIEMHLFDDQCGQKRKRTLSKSMPQYDCIRSAMCYLEDRLHGARVPGVCEGCKERAIPFAVNVAQDLEADGLMDEAEEYRQLVETLAEGDEQLDGRPARPCVGVFCVSQPVPGAPDRLGEATKTLDDGLFCSNYNLLKV